MAVQKETSAVQHLQAGCGHPTASRASLHQFGPLLKNIGSLLQPHSRLPQLLQKSLHASKCRFDIPKQIFEILFKHKRINTVTRSIPTFSVFFCLFFFFPTSLFVFALHFCSLFTAPSPFFFSFHPYSWKTFLFKHLPSSSLRPDNW